MKSLFFGSCLWLLLTISSIAQPYQSTWASVDSRPVPTWFEDAKFGIFIHWGVYAVPAYSPTARDSVGIYDRYAEHYWRRLRSGGKTQPYFTQFHNRMYGPQVQYQDFARDFRAEMFQPNDWADLFKKAGARYVVLTSKHHEGYPLWPSPHSPNWNAVDIGPHRDLLGDLTTAVRDQGLRMGYYYSLLEWYHPLYKKETIGQYVDQHMLPQMKDLVTRYKPDVVWTDGEWDYPSNVLKSTDFLSWLYNDSPVRDYVVVNDRWGNETRSKHGGIFTTEYDLIHEGNSTGVKFARPWEECRGIGGSFGYNRAENLDEYATSKQLIDMLVDKVARGGNLLLNIGPTADGRIPVIMQQRLRDMGDWLATNGEAIYGTRAWEKAAIPTPTTRVFYTRKGRDLYAICTAWPTADLVIAGVRKPSRVSLLGFKDNRPGTNGLVTAKTSGQTVRIAPPAVSPATLPGQHAWVFKLENVL